MVKSMAYVPKYIIKRIVPKDAVANLDLNGDGKADAVGCKYVNILTPLTIEGTKEEILSQFVGVQIDDKLYSDLTQLCLYFEGELLELKDFDKIKGKTLPVGGKILIIIKIPGGVAPGMHKLGMKTKYKDQENYNEVEREIPPEVKTIDQLYA